MVSLNSLRTYMAAKHSFQAAQLTAEDARQMVILAVGNAYLRVLADQAQIDTTAAQVETSKVSLGQASPTITRLAPHQSLMSCAHRSIRKVCSNS